MYKPASNALQEHVRHMHRNDASAIALGVCHCRRATYTHTHYTRRKQLHMRAHMSYMATTSAHMHKCMDPKRYSDKAHMHKCMDPKR